MGIWALHGDYKKGWEKPRKDKHLEDVKYIILSYAQRTNILRLWLIQDPNPERDEKGNLKSDDVGLLKFSLHFIGDEDDGMGLDLSSRTIALGRATRGLTIQITETSLRATSLPFPPPEYSDIEAEVTEDKKPNKSELEDERSQERYMAGDNTIVTLAAQQEGQFYVEFGTFAAKYQPLDHKITLQSRPSCLSVLVVEGLTFVLIGTLAGKLEVYVTAEIVAGPFNPAANFRHAFAGPFGICDSLATITRTTTMGLQPLLVCGLRDGTVEILSLSKVEDKCEFTARVIYLGMNMLTVPKTS